MTLRAHVAFLVCLLSGTIAWAQPKAAEKGPHGFYTSQAKSDGIYEQSLVFQSEKDEWDYWRDQRMYERLLFQKDTELYTAYILSKRAVYATHRALCDSRCGHGDYYFIQAAYYLQFAEGDAVYLTLKNPEKVPGVGPALFVRQ